MVGDKTTAVHARDLVAGQNYRIEFDDCCVRGFVASARFLGKKSYADGSGDLTDYFVVEFEGIEIATWWGCGFYPVTTDGR